MRGLPWSITEGEVDTFFQGFDPIKKSIKIGILENGRKTGNGALLFESEEEAEKAVLQKQGEMINNRWLELFQETYTQYEKFGGDQQKSEYVNIKKYIN